MNIVGKKVSHRQFGIGEIVKQDDHMVTVRFEACEKQFVFPSAFDGFLTMVDAAQATKMNTMLREMKDHDDAEKSRLEDEESRRKATEQLAVLKKNRDTAAKKAASRKRTPQKKADTERPVS